MDALEKKLGYEFRDPALIKTALTHSSYANEHRCQSNERLEYVGDSVLGMVVATHLYKLYPDMPEGKLTRLRAELVCEHSLWTVADKLDFGKHLRLGKGEELTGGRERHSILADCVEAVIAAMYLDGGIEPTRRFIDEHILSQLASGAPIGVTDYKTELQEMVQKRPGHTLSYELAGESGPDHRKTFAFRVSLDGAVIGEGEGHTKKEAEQNAAKCALEGIKSE